MRKLFIVISCFLIFICLASCNKSTQVEKNEPNNIVESTQQDKPKKQSRIDVLKIDSKNIANNLVKESTIQSTYVYLPPSYFESDKKYPVVYYLPGFGDGFGTVASLGYLSIDDAIKNQNMNEMIVVEINNKSVLGGHFYVNSPVIGNWEDYIIKELIPEIDSKYRTIKDSNSRGICGFSMGGFGCVNLALKHPDVFSSVYAVCPGIIDESKFDMAMTSWKGDKQFLEAYGAAFSPNTQGSYPFCNIPKMDGSKEDTAVLENWKHGFGYWNEKIDAYLALNKPLKSIHIKYSSDDQYSWIPEGVVYASQLFKNKNIACETEEYKGGHRLPNDFIKKDMIPFFSKNLISN